MGERGEGLVRVIVWLSMHAVWKTNKLKLSYLSSSCN